VILGYAALAKPKSNELAKNMVTIKHTTRLFPNPSLAFKKESPSLENKRLKKKSAATNN
jgi:hypothetical protein